MFQLQCSFITKLMQASHLPVYIQLLLIRGQRIRWQIEAGGSNDRKWKVDK
jgi:hypothetical protein